MIEAIEIACATGAFADRSKSDLAQAADLGEYSRNTMTDDCINM
jgi:hypothetical protein